MYTMAKNGIILDPDRRECTESTEGILFWTIRATVISTAINPLLYGFLAQQYRGAYIYLIKTLLSKCCYCVSQPSENVFCKWMCKCILTYANILLYNDMYVCCTCMFPILL